MKISAAVFHRSVHLDGGKLEPPDAACPFCASTDRKPVCLVQNDPDVFFLECGRCHAVSASRMPKESALAEYYGGYYHSAQFSESTEKTTFHGLSRFGRHLASLFLQHAGGSHVSILDYGGGDGGLSHSVALELLARGVDRVDIVVVDYNEDVMPPRDQRISITRVGTLENTSGEFHLVIASAIIEHIPGARDVLQGCLNRMRKGGLFYARTPYMVPLLRLCARVGIKLDLTYPAHVHDLGQGFWESYFGRTAADGSLRIVASKPSIVETTFRRAFLKTLAAYTLKAPWRVLGRTYAWVGGWEILVQKT